MRYFQPILFRLGLDIAQGAVDRVGLPDLEDVIVFPARGRIVGLEVLPVSLHLLWF